MSRLRAGLKTVIGAAFFGLLLTGGCSETPPMTPLESGRAAFLAGEWEMAVADCTVAIRANPKDATAYLLRGRAQHCLGQRELAIADLSEAIRLAPNDPEAYYQRASVYKDQGKTELEAADEVTGRKIDPFYQHAYLYAPSAPMNVEAESESLSFHSTGLETGGELDHALEAAIQAAQSPAAGQAAPGGQAANGGARRPPSSEAGPPAGADGRRAVNDVYGAPVSSRSITEELLGIELPRTGAAAGTGFDVGQASRARAALEAQRQAIGEDLERPPLGEIETDERAARQRPLAGRGSGRLPQQGAGRDVAGGLPVERSINPYGVRPMRSTGVVEEEDEAFDGQSPPGGRYSGGGGAGGGRAQSYGGNAYSRPTDPYGGYTAGSGYGAGGSGSNTTRYGGSLTPYGAPGGQSGARGGGQRSSNSGGRGSAGPYAPAQGAAPYFPPTPGVRN